MRLTTACVVLFALLLVSVVVAIGLGTAVITPADTARYLWAALSGGKIGAGEASTYQIVWEIRTPRVLLAALVGAGLSTIGVAVQAMVRNALADPYVLGVSSGASVGAVGVTVTGGLAGLGVYAMSAGAFLGALAASALVYAAAAGRAGMSPLRLILTGVAMALGFQAVMSVIIYLVPNSEATSTVLYWTMGSFGAATWAALPAVALAVVLGLSVLNRCSRALDVMALGDETAASLGVDPDRHRKGLLVLVSLVTGAMVAVSGAISFVGLVMPHLVRMVVGSTHARVLAVSPLVGAVFMVWVDLVARTLVAPRELPLGVITALVGVPVFVTLMRRKAYMFGGR
ncbi:sugar ABC transporter substrate-binding protein [Streptomyces abyssalis]|uniref:Sugar ABC transporter substrate-binding protein n=1 Tax=Streptomyces abyssalis TaxID=933944 RepID=A0A1E7JQR3_9ACTN|nr:iron ABC transporter permease [Streptomyces abyssalis]OEU87538.1 sugar ABC transporter substrate-binding protein [Streptomyces abyssalis]OEU90608.1 sugar ABC transporter substrate-binding protein [Streptomyces abyssalis]OEV08233.1 sugar ABC transporter substrate-binding protein [Streptomyces nanshensis]